MDAFRLRSLPTQWIGREVRVFDTLDSTNSHALSLGDDPSLDGVVILTHAQSAGRGQFGRTWLAPARSSVLLSVLLFPPASLRRPVILTSWAAVAVAEVIRTLTGVQAKIKWPNDVLIDGKKVCGILIEQRTTGRPDFPLATVAGIGLNVSQSAESFQAAGLPDAGSLFSASGRALAFESVAESLLRQLDADYDQLVSGDLQTLESLWVRRLGLLGKPVRAGLADRQVHGRLVDLSFDGLVLEADGELHQLAPEQVRQLSAI